MVTKAKSSREWGKKEFQLHIERLQKFFSERGLFIADPLSVETKFTSELDDNSLMPFGPFENTRMKDVPDDYLIELYSNPSRFCPPALKEYIEEIELC